MGYSRKEWEDLVAKGKERLTEANRAALTAAQHSGVEAEYLTGDARWNWFIGEVDKRRSTRQARLDEASRILNDPNIVSTDAIMRAKIAVAVEQEVIAALTEVIKIPSQMIEQGEKARDALSKQDKADQTAVA